MNSKVTGAGGRSLCSLYEKECNKYGKVKEWVLGMWIRTQNNYILANVNSLRICKCDIDGCAYCSIHGHYDRYEQELGIYSSECKALMVLDKIENYLEYSHNIVFQMPQDEEDF